METDHVLASMRATLAPGTSRSSSGMLVAPDRRISSWVMTKTAAPALAECAAEGRVIKERIVPETARSAGLIEDSAFHHAAIHAEQARAFHQRDGAHEAGSAILHSSELLQKQAVVGFSAAFVAGLCA